MLDLCNLYKDDNISGGSSGENLYSILIGCLNKHQIPLENLVGFAADGASNIMREQNSLCSRLRENLLAITIFKCICHSLHLCSQRMPKLCPEYVRIYYGISIYSYFSQSAKRSHELKEFKVFCDVKPHKILHAFQTR